MSVVIHVDTFHPTIARENKSIIKVGGVLKSMLTLNEAIIDVKES